MKFDKLKCGITGHTGILGKELLKRNDKIKFVKFNGDITKKKDIKKWLQNNPIDIIVHLAAIVPTNVVKRKFSYANKVNYIGTKLLVDEIIKYKNIKWLFYSSTSHVYNFSKNRISEDGIIKPISKYGLTKLKGENYIKKKLNKKISFCIGRIFSFTSVNQIKDYVIPGIMSKVKSKKNKIFFKNTNHLRDFLCVSDICKAIKILIHKKSTGTYNIGSGNKVLISDIIKLIFKKYKKEYLIKNTSKQTCLVANNSKIKKLNWQPTKDIKEIVKELF
ncbi:SDR family oxidoreductase [Pelagibacteraceae bacterium]|nr:SDR family oxidoreductase [Candidatus Pelagibacter sp.]MDC1485745.1 SDR family oxidoreductase [Pelagibacteraceae bacterium]